MLGSSSLDLQKGLSESLAGRFQLIKVYHWNHLESHSAYSLRFDDFLKFGGYPGSYKMISDHRVWVEYVKNSIITTVVEKDILQNAKVKSPSLFKQSFEIITAYPCNEISYTKLLGQIQDEYESQEKGFAFEALVGTQLLRTGETLYYWRDGDYELDFVIKKGRKIWAIKVKSGRQKKAKSMRKFLSKYPEATAVFIDLKNYFEFEKAPLEFLKKY